MKNKDLCKVLDSDTLLIFEDDESLNEVELHADCSLMPMDEYYKDHDDWYEVLL